MKYYFSVDKVWTGEDGNLENWDLLGVIDLGDVYCELLPWSLPSKNDGKNWEFDAVFSKSEAFWDVFGEPIVMGSIELSIYFNFNNNDKTATTTQYDKIYIK